VPEGPKIAVPIAKPLVIDSTSPELDLWMEKKPFVQGRYSHVYRALYKGKEAVVKRLNGNKEDLKEQFLTEVLIIG
jgi:hypothetical protein